MIPVQTTKPNVKMRIGIAAPIQKFGTTGGAVQIEILDPLDTGWFKNTQNIENFFKNN